jgi:hypothetical protein
MYACRMTLFSSLHLMRIYHVVFDKCMEDDYADGYEADVDAAKSRAKWACKWGKDLWRRAYVWHFKNRQGTT